MMARRTALALAAVILAAGIAACGVPIPADPDGTLERVSGGTLRVGVTANGMWASVREGEEPGGIEPTLVRSFASSLGAVPEWVTGSEQELTKALKEGELDLVVGGFAADTPWITHAGTTRPYTESQDAFGNTVKHVFLVPLGENGFLLALDRFLLSQDVKA
jgi:ABC-type amino acid transport substrate-binding protein